MYCVIVSKRKYFKENYKLLSIDLSNQQGLDADPKAEQQINLTKI